MFSIRKAGLAVVMIVISQAAWAQSGVVSQNYSCDALKAMMKQNGKLIIRYDKSNGSLFELVYNTRGSFACGNMVPSGACKDFWVKTNDSSACLIGQIEVHDSRNQSEPVETTPASDPQPVDLEPEDEG